MKRALLFFLSVVAVHVFAEDRCLELCSSCMNEDKQDVCTKVEVLCKCSDILEKLRQELEQASQIPPDTNTLPSDTLAMSDSAEFKDSTMTNQDSLNVIDSNAVTQTQAPLDSVDTNSVTQTQAPLDSVDSNSPLVEKERVSSLQEPESPANENKQRIFYFGISLGFEQFQEKTVANRKVVEAGGIYNHLGADLGFLLRWYFKTATSIQTGLNSIYHHGYNSIEGSDFKVGFGDAFYNRDVTIEYHSLMVEVPLTFRLGVPYVISPYVSLSIHVRKPIYVWMDYDVDISWTMGDYFSFNNRDYNYDDNSSMSGAFAEEDWEFLGFLGFGIELTRHFSVQWQLLLLNIVTYSEETLNYRLFDETWRLNLDFAF